MDKLLNKPKKEIVALFEEAAAQLDLMPYIIEKDFWVCWILEKIYSSYPKPPIIFKGGTSLSKIYGVINRFSEDVDLTIDKQALGNTKDPTENGLSQKEVTRRVGNIRKAAESYIAGPFFLYLENVIKDSFNNNFDWQLVLDDDKQTILFYYPQFSTNIQEESYIRPIIRLELGARGGITPKEYKPIQPYMANIFPRLFEKNEILQIPTLSIERTFWEKILILHSLYHKYIKGKRIGHRMSRHYYDIYMMDKKDLIGKALEQKALFTEVVKHTEVFFKDNNAAYNKAKLGELKLNPTNEMFTELEQDYKEMEIMMIGEYPSFKKIISTIEKIEQCLNFN